MQLLQLLQLLQESSSLSLSDLKKAITKDKRAALIFKKDLTLDDIEDKDSFLSSIKFYILNNSNVRSFINDRSNIKLLNSNEFNALRKLRSSDLTPQVLSSLSSFVSSLFKEHTSVSKAVFSKDLKKELVDWIETSGRHHSLSKFAQQELMSISSIRPNKKIVLYRGVLFNERDLETYKQWDGTLSVGNGLKFIKSIRDNQTTVDLEWGKPSSWTLDKTVAERFAKFGPASSSFAAHMQWFDRQSAKKAIDGELGYVISVLADPEDILIDLNMLNKDLGTSFGDEAEVILNPGTFTARIVKKYKVSGEVDPKEKDSDSDGEVLAALSKMQAFKESFPMPENKSLPSIFNALSLLKTPQEFKSYIINGSTTHIAHAFDSLMQFYTQNLESITNEKIQSAMITADSDMSEKISNLKKVISSFTKTVKHSKFKGVGNLYKLNADEYRLLLTSDDLSEMEKCVLVNGKISAACAPSIHALAKSLEIPVTGSINQSNLTKQRELLNQIVDKFYSSYGIPKKSDDFNENFRVMISYIKKAYRNYHILELVKSIVSKF